jgi:hypothetical protein
MPRDTTLVVLIEISEDDNAGSQIIVDDSFTVHVCNGSGNSKQNTNARNGIR